MSKKGKLFFLLLATLFIFAGTAKAQVPVDQYQSCLCGNGTKYTVPTCADCITQCKNSGGATLCVPVANAPTANSGSSDTSIKLDNPLGSVTTPQVLIGKIINSVLGVVGSLALLMFIFGGLTWMTSGGSADKVKKGKDIIVWSAIGLVVIFASYGLVRFLILNIK